MTPPKFSICHNEDNSRVKNHRRVMLTFEGGILPEMQRWYADGKPLAWYTSVANAEADIRWVYCDPAWDLREE
jgi:hypothetical protein